MARDDRARTYDTLSRWYSLMAEPSEGPLRRECLDMLHLQPGEAVLEIGSGPGADLPAMAERVGSTGVVWGLDLSRRMLRVCVRGLRGRPEQHRIRPIQGDGLRLPCRANAFHALLLSFTLELFEEQESLLVLRETARVLRPGGRLGVVCLSNRHPDELATRLYWRAHRACPSLIDCRPIDAPAILEANGYRLVHTVERSMWGIRATVLVACRT